MTDKTTDSPSLNCGGKRNNEPKDLFPVDHIANVNGIKNKKKKIHTSEQIDFIFDMAMRLSLKNLPSDGSDSDDEGDSDSKFKMDFEKIRGGEDGYDMTFKSMCRTLEALKIWYDYDEREEKINEAIAFDLTNTWAHYLRCLKSFDEGHLVKCVQEIKYVRSWISKDNLSRFDLRSLLDDLCLRANAESKSLKNFLAKFRCESDKKKRLDMLEQKWSKLKDSHKTGFIYTVFQYLEGCTNIAFGLNSSAAVCLREVKPYWSGMLSVLAHYRLAEIYVSNGEHSRALEIIDEEMKKNFVKDHPLVMAQFLKVKSKSLLSFTGMEKDAKTTLEQAHQLEHEQRNTLSGTRRGIDIESLEIETIDKELFTK